MPQRLSVALPVNSAVSTGISLRLKSDRTHTVPHLSTNALLWTSPLRQQWHWTTQVGLTLPSLYLTDDPLVSRRMATSLVVTSSARSSTAKTKCKSDRSAVCAAPTGPAMLPSSRASCVVGPEVRRRTLARRKATIEGGIQVNALLLHDWL